MSVEGCDDEPSEIARLAEWGLPILLRKQEKNTRRKRGRWRKGDKSAMSTAKKKRRADLEVRQTEREMRAALEQYEIEKNPEREIDVRTYMETEDRRIRAKIAGQIERMWMKFEEEKAKIQNDIAAQEDGFADGYGDAVDGIDNENIVAAYYLGYLVGFDGELSSAFTAKLADIKDSDEYKEAFGNARFDIGEGEDERAYRSGYYDGYMEGLKRRRKLNRRNRIKSLQNELREPWAS